ncbi:NUDIX domain-containing protein [Frankia sp. AgB1.9]|nr:MULTISPECIES: NUDIX domain-containing protein [unclassified Frankia]MBL7487257.1 NUDIX domain-containing protein [Frankia sp. AgW1.1]MBL7547383.1 NUDIX domain-containing protein [Frankia sp. AgB1.9]
MCGSGGASVAGQQSGDSVRLAARVVLLHTSGAVLLQLHGGPHEPHWACPGGGIEPGEDPLAAARRELLEETGRDDEPGDQLWEWRHRFFFAGEPVTQHETYFLARTASRHVPRHLPDPEDGIVLRAWLTTGEIRRLAEPVWPPDLPDLVDRLG